MAIAKFTDLLARGRSLQLYGTGQTRRDYTFIDDIVDGIELDVAQLACHDDLFERLRMHGSSKQCDDARGEAAVWSSHGTILKAHDEVGAVRKKREGLDESLFLRRHDPDQVRRVRLKAISARERAPLGTAGIIAGTCHEGKPFPVRRLCAERDGRAPQPGSASPTPRR